MELFIDWCGFIGAWLLFAGPIYQAAIELSEHDIESARIRAAETSVPAQPDVSPWWWFFPPLKIYLERRRSTRYRREYFAALASEDATTLVAFMNKATGWLFVAAGALLIAFKETFELVERMHLETYVFWLAIIFMFLGSILNTVLRISSRQQMLGKG